MKKRKTRIAALGLTVCMLMTLLGGCGETDSSDNQVENVTSTQEDAGTVKKEGYPITDEKSSLSVLSGNVVVITDPDECDIQNEIAELTNVDIDWELIQQGTFEEKKGLIFARTELPDVIMVYTSGISDAEYLNMIDAGQLVAIDEYLEYAPNFCQVLENSQGLREAITAPDGHIYAFPCFQGGGETYMGMTDAVTYIDQTWLDALGLEMPTTTDELKDVLVAFKEGDPNGNGIADEIGLTAVKDLKELDDWFGAFGIIPSANELNVRNLTMMDGEVVYAPTRDEYRNALDYFHELWELGVVDPELFTMDWSMYNAKLKTETRTLGMFRSWRGDSWRLSDDDTEYSVLPALTGPDGDSLYRQRYVGIIARAGAMITTDCENIELAMRWIDTLIDPKYSYQFANGQREGYHYEVNDDGTKSIIRTPNTSDPEEIKMVDMRFTCLDWTTIATKPVSSDPLTVDNEKAVSDAIYMPNYPTEHYPNVFLTLDESNVVSEIGADLQLYMDEFYANWIVNGGDDAAWDAHLKQLESLGVNEWVETYTNALERYNAL